MAGSTYGNSPGLRGRQPPASFPASFPAPILICYARPSHVRGVLQRRMSGDLGAVLPSRLLDSIQHAIMASVTSIGMKPRKSTMGTAFTLC